MEQKGLAPIVIVVLMAVLAVGGYLIYKLPRTVTPLPTPQTTPAPSPTPSPSPAPTGTKETADWKIYSNPKLGYSVKYPKSWYLSEHDWGSIIENKKTLEPPDTPVSPETPQDPTYFNIQITTYGKKADLSLRDWIINVWDRMLEIVNPPLEPEQLIVISIDKVQGYKLEFRGAEITSTHIFLESNQNKVYEISAAFNHSGEEKIFNQILSTFRFLP